MRHRSDSSPIACAFSESEGAIKRLLARILPRRPDVEDLAQETFLRAFAAEGEQEILFPRAFLLKIARNLAINESQRMRHATTSALEDFPSPDVLGSDSQPSEDDKVYSRQKLIAFAEAVSALPEQCRKVFILRKVHGLSQREVAVSLGVTESTVEKHVAAGLLRTSEFLRRRGFDEAQQASVHPLRDMAWPKSKRSADG